ncbi:hypothetical protein WJX77_003270 [Trebouxia sp. C0004]
MANPSYSGRLLEDERFLFLQENYPKIASLPHPSRKWSGMELLLDPHHHGKVFIQSIYVTDAPTYQDWGSTTQGIRPSSVGSVVTAMPLMSGCWCWANDLKSLGFVTVEAPETVYLLFKEAKLLQSREDLWEIRKNKILALPNLLDGMSAEQRIGLDWMQDELLKVFRKCVKPGQNEFRAMPLTGGHSNEHVLCGFTTHLVIDINIVRCPEEVRKRLAAMLGSHYECQEVDCQCQRKLLSNSMADALSSPERWTIKDRIWHNVMAEYMQVRPAGIHGGSPGSSLWIMCQVSTWLLSTSLVGPQLWQVDSKAASLMGPRKSIYRQTPGGPRCASAQDIYDTRNARSHVVSKQYPGSSGISVKAQCW